MTLRQLHVPRKDLFGVEMKKSKCLHVTCTLNTCPSKLVCSFTPNNCFQAEIEKYKAERERAFAEYEAKFAGAKDDIATRFAILV